MAFRREILELVQRYAKEKHNRNVTLEELWRVPWHHIVSTWWNAQVHYRMNHFYRSLEDAPKEEGITVYIRTPKGLDSYTYREGQWGYNGNVTEDMYKE